MKNRIIYPTVIFCIGVVAGLAVWSMLRSREERLTESEFQMVARESAKVIQRAFEEHVELLHSIAAFYAGSQFVDDGEFHVFTEPLIGRHQSVLALDWLPRVQKQGRGEFESQIRVERSNDFRIRELDAQGHLVDAGVRDVYFPVLYSIQSGQNAAVNYGFDHAADPVRWRAMQLARDTGEAVASERITLLEMSGATEDLHGVLVAMPIYANGAPRATVRQRRANLTGFVVGIFRMADVVDRALNDVRYADIDFRIRDKDAASDRQLLRVRAAPRDLPITNAHLVDQLRSRQVWWQSSTIAVAGREWLIESSPVTVFVTSRQTMGPLASLLFGIIVTGMLAAYVHLILGRTAHVEREVTERTAELARANERLLQEVREREAAEATIAEDAKRLEVVNCDLREARFVLNQTVEQLRHKNQELDEFTYVASHDLQEPVRKLISFSKLLEEDLGDDLNEQAAKDLKFIVDAATRMRDLVQALLALSRAGRSAMKRELVSLEHCARQAIDSLALRIQETNAQIVFGPLPNVMGDETMLTQLYQNLVSNALKFTADGPPTIHLTAERDGEQWILGVKDNGIGMKSDYYERIFQPFQRLHGRGEYPGTGIGLSICKKTVERHGGRIWVESAPAEGSHFQFTMQPIPETEPCDSKEQIQADALLSC